MRSSRWTSAVARSTGRSINCPARKPFSTAFLSGLSQTTCQALIHARAHYQLFIHCALLQHFTLAVDLREHLAIRVGEPDFDHRPVNAHRSLQCTP